HACSRAFSFMHACPPAYRVCRPEQWGKCFPSQNYCGSIIGLEPAICSPGAMVVPTEGRGRDRSLDRPAGCAIIRPVPLPCPESKRPGDTSLLQAGPAVARAEGVDAAELPAMKLTHDLQTRRLRLTPLNLDHVDAILEWANDPAVTGNSQFFRGPSDRKRIARFILELEDDPDRASDAAFARDDCDDCD